MMGGAKPTIVDQRTHNFLGDDPSVHYHDPSFQMYSERRSLDNLKSNGIPPSFFLKMPTLNCKRSELNNFLSSISAESWMMPYIIACVPPLNLNLLSQKASLAPSVSPFHHLKQPGLTKGISLPSLPTIVEDIQVNLPVPVDPPMMSVRSLCHKSFDQEDDNTSSSPSTGTTISHSPIGVPQLSVSFNHTNSSNKSLRSSSWKSIGILLVTNDPRWNPWAARLLVLMDNFIFECMVDGSTIIGYIPLSKANINVVTLTKNILPKPSEQSDNAVRDSNGVPINNNNVTQQYIEVIEISYLKTCDPQSQRAHAFIQFSSKSELLSVLEELVTAASMSLRDQYIMTDADLLNLRQRGMKKEYILRVFVILRSPLIILFFSCLNLMIVFIGRPAHVVRAQRTRPVESDGPKSVCSTLDESMSGGKRMSLSNSRRSRPHQVSFDHTTVAEVAPAIGAMSLSSDEQFIPDGSPIVSFLPDSNTFRRQLSENFDCALKISFKDKFIERVNDGEERADALVREVLSQATVCKAAREAISNSKAMPIVQIYSVFETVDVFCMELELMDRRDLCALLDDVGVLSEEDAKDVIRQILKALIICRRAGVAHRDVKLSNILIALPKRSNHLSDITPRRLIVKLADFGMAGFVSNDGTVCGRCGTIGYVAPEILEAGVHERYANNVDIFSVS